MPKLPVGGERVDAPESLRGRLLIATPMIGDGNFDRSVVAMIEHNDGGSLGVIINQPLDHAVSEAIEGWEERLAEPAVLFDGGPVGETTLIALGLAPRPSADEALTAVGGIDGLVVVDLDADPVITQAHLTSQRVYAGYAGWSPGQLESEIHAGAWFVAKARASDIFSGTPSEVRESVLRRQPNGARFFTHHPDDPALN